MKRPTARELEQLRDQTQRTADAYHAWVTLPPRDGALAQAYDDEMERLFHLAVQVFGVPLPAVTP